jgi:hypothetical protein
MTSTVNTKTLNKVETLDSAVRKVNWRITFADSEHPDISSIAIIVTYLDTAQTGQMIPSQLTQSQILEWVLAAQGGDEFINQLWENGHKQDLEQKIADSYLIEMDVDDIPE